MVSGENREPSFFLKAHPRKDAKPQNDQMFLTGVGDSGFRLLEQRNQIDPLATDYSMFFKGKDQRIGIRCTLTFCFCIPICFSVPYCQIAFDLFQFSLSQRPHSPYSANFHHFHRY